MQAFRPKSKAPPLKFVKDGAPLNSKSLKARATRPARFAPLAPQKPSARRTIEFDLRAQRMRSAAFLATSLLRFQCVESEKEG